MSILDEVRNEFDTEGIEAAWNKLVVKFLSGRGYEFIEKGPLAFSLVVYGPEPAAVKSAENQSEKRRWLVLCRLKKHPPVIDLNNLIPYLNQINATGVIGFDYPETSEQQKAEFASLPDTFSHYDFDTKKHVRDICTDTEFYQRFEIAVRAKNILGYSRRPLVFIPGLLFLWMTVAVSVQYDWWVPVIVYLSLIAILIVASLLFGFVLGIAEIGGPYVVGIVGIPVTVSWLVGPYNGWRDLTIALIVFVIVLWFGSRIVAPLVERIHRPDPEQQELARRNWRRRYKAAMWLMVTWITVSLADSRFGPLFWTTIEPLETYPITRDNTKNSDGSNERYGLALSGGGYRAALFHAGVLAALESKKINISGLSTVSGGSIIGGYYALGGKPSSFKDAVLQGRFNLKRELMGIHNVLRLPCPGRIPVKDLELLWFCSFGRHDVQGAILSKNIFKDVTLEQLAKNNNSIPWIIAGTDLVSGQAIGFSLDGIIQLDQAVPDADNDSGALPNIPTKAKSRELAELGKLKVAQLVAASGAFPGAFQAVSFGDTKDPSKIQIADGGLTDNYGFSLLASAHVFGDSWKFDSILVSDGSQLLERFKKTRGTSQIVRAMDVVYASAGIDPHNADPLPKVVRFSPQLLDDKDGQLIERIVSYHTLRNESLNAEYIKKRLEKCKEAFRETPTLKDQFEEDDAQCIYDLGIYAVAASLFGKRQ